MKYPGTSDLSYQEIENGALVLLLLRKGNTWEQLCSHYAYSDPLQIRTNTTTMILLSKVFALRELGLLEFETEETTDGEKPIGEIKETGLWSKIRVAFGGLSLTEVAIISQHSTGMAVVPAFGRPQPPAKKIDVFVLMPFNQKMEKVYTNHIRTLGTELGLSIQRADEIFSPRPFMDKVWDGICAAEFILADCTEKNANVFYEIGLAHTVGKKVVLITRSDKDIPADIKHLDYIRYDYDPEGVEELIKTLRTFLKEQFKL